MKWVHIDNESAMLIAIGLILFHVGNIFTSLLGLVPVLMGVLNIVANSSKLTISKKNEDVS